MWKNKSYHAINMCVSPSAGFPRHLIFSFQSTFIPLGFRLFRPLILLHPPVKYRVSPCSRSPFDTLSLSVSFSFSVTFSLAWESNVNSCHEHVRAPQHGSPEMT